MVMWNVIIKMRRPIVQHENDCGNARGNAESGDQVPEIATTSVDECANETDDVADEMIKKKERAKVNGILRARGPKGTSIVSEKLKSRICGFWIELAEP